MFKKNSRKRKNQEDIKKNATGNINNIEVQNHGEVLAVNSVNKSRTRIPRLISSEDKENKFSKLPLRSNHAHPLGVSTEIQEVIIKKIERVEEKVEEIKKEILDLKRKLVGRHNETIQFSKATRKHLDIFMKDYNIEGPEEIEFNRVFKNIDWKKFAINVNDDIGFKFTSREDECITNYIEYIKKIFKVWPKVLDIVDTSRGDLLDISTKNLVAHGRTDVLISRFGVDNVNTAFFSIEIKKVVSSRWVQSALQLISAHIKSTYATLHLLTNLDESWNFSWIGRNKDNAVLRRLIIPPKDYCSEFGTTQRIAALSFIDWWIKKILHEKEIVEVNPESLAIFNFPIISNDIKTKIIIKLPPSQDLDDQP